MQVFMYLGITISPLVIKYLLEKIYNTTNSFSVNDCNNDSTFFTTYKNYICRKHIFQKIQCSSKCSYTYLGRILNCIESATKTISLCVCLLTLNEICNALIEAKNRGIEIRLISDNQMIEVVAAKKNLLLNLGIKIKVQPRKYANTLMHHKFCLIDEFDHVNARLFYGSLNLTIQGLSSNWEVVVFSKNQKLIKYFSKEFEYLWNTFQNVDINSNE